MPKRFKVNLQFVGRKFFTRVLLILWICLMGIRATAGNASAPPDYSFDVWQTEDGLPYNSVTAILQTRDGYLWLGTYNGLVRFDGVRFTVFDTSNTPELRSSRVTSLLEDGDGRLWIGHETGDLTQFFEGQFKHIEWGRGLTGGQISAIETDKNSGLWLLNNAGSLLRFEDFHSLSTGAGSATADRVASLVKDKNGNLWALRDTSLSLLEKNHLVPMQSSPTNDFRRACASRNGDLWIVGNGRIKKWTGTEWGKDWGAAPWGASGTALTMLETKSGDLLVGTLESGLFLLSAEGGYRQFSRTNGLPRDWVRCLAQDAEGNIWIGTGGGGLAALRKRTVSMVKTPDDWQGTSVLSVTPRAEGGVWVGTEGAGLYQVTENATIRYAMTNGLWNLFEWSVLENPPGKLWVGSWGNGLFSKEGEAFKQPTGLDAPSPIVTAIYRGRDGALWLGTADGLGRYQDGACIWYGRKDGMSLLEIRTIIEDASGVIWFGMSGGGLGQLKDGKIRQFHRSDGLASDFVWALQTDIDGTLWIGTFGGGLCRLRDGKFATISIREGLPNNVICHIADVGTGDFWLSSYGGIFRVAKADLNQCADGNEKSVYCFTYGKADGLNSLECSGGLQPSGCQTADGRLWFPTTKGLAVVDPSKVTLNPKPPPVVIETVSMDDKVILLAGTHISTLAPLVIQPGRQRFEFHYTALSFVAPEKVRFKYRLEGLEPDWQEAGGRRVGYYSYLRPGDYRFHVIACNNDGVWNDAGASLALRVLPHYWQTWWFLGMAVLAGGGVVGGGARSITRRRLRQKMERLERQRAIERERSRIAQDIHDDLGASLTRIIMLSQSGRPDLEDMPETASDMKQIYGIARELTRAMDEIVWAVSPQHDTLDSLVTYLGKFAQDFLSVAGIRCRLNVPIELPAWHLTAEVRHNLFLAFKEALHNVLKHAAATEARISLTPAQYSFCLMIEDNGKGFEIGSNGKNPAADVADQHLRFSGGRGLGNMKQRLVEIGGTCELKSAPGEGACVKFVVPVKI